MVRTAEFARGHRPNPAELRRVDEKVTGFQRGSLGHSIRSVKRRRGRCSQAEVARWCAVSIDTVEKALDPKRKKPMNMAWVARSKLLGATYELRYCRAFTSWDAKGRP